MGGKEGRGEGEGRRIRKIKQDGHSIHEKHEMLGTGHHGVCHFSGPCILQVAYNVLFVSVVLCLLVLSLVSVSFCRMNLQSILVPRESGSSGRRSFVRWSGRTSQTCSSTQA